MKWTITAAVHAAAVAVASVRMSAILSARAITRLVYTQTVTRPNPERVMHAA